MSVTRRSICRDPAQLATYRCTPWSTLLQNAADPLSCVSSALFRFVYTRVCAALHMVRSLLLSLAALSSWGLAAAAHGIVPNSYIVEFTNNTNVKRSVGQLSHHDELRGHIKRAAIPFINQRDYDQPNIFVGVSIKLENAQDVHTIRAMPNVKAVYADKEVTAPARTAKPVVLSNNRVKRATTANDTFSAHVMTRINELRAEGITGKGVTVCVIDTGHVAIRCFAFRLCRLADIYVQSRL